MLILELAVQGVRGFSPSARIPLKPGYIGLKSPTEIPAPFQGLFLSLVYPDGRGSDAAFIAPGAKGARAGLSLQADDQSVWRIVRDLGGAGALHLLNKQTSQYEVVTQDTTEVAQLLRARVRLPDRSTFQSLFTFVPAQLPSKHLKQVAAPVAQTSKLAPAPSRRGMSDGELAEAQARIEHLEGELKLANDVAEEQFKLDGIQSEIFKTEQKLKDYRELKEKVEAARAEIKTAPTTQSLGLPEDIVARAKRFKEDRRQHEAALRLLEEERLRAGVTDSRPAAIEPLYKDRRFLGSAIGGLVLLVAAGFVDGPAKFIALISVAGFTVAGLLALRHIEELQHNSREGAKGDVFGNREKKLKEEFLASAKVVESALEMVNATTFDEFAAAMARKDELLPELTRLELELVELEAEPETAGLETDVAHLKAEYEELNERVTSLSGGYARDTREIKGELESLKDAIEAANAPPPEPEKVSQPFTAIADNSPKYEDPMPQLMNLTRELFAADVSTMWSVLRERTMQYFTALTDRRYHDVDLDKNGAATVVAPGRTLLASDMPARDLDLLYLSARLTIIEKWSAQQVLPVLMEDAFANIIDAAKQPLFARMLKHVGTLTQVIHVTGLTQPTYAEVVQAI